MWGSHVARRAGRTRNNHARRLQVESLEKREVLSGFAGASATMDLAIRGTDVQFSELGLPASMSGDVFSSADEGASRIGRYQETLNPILMDVTGDQIPDFVGTTGVATFEFFVGSQAWGLGSITTNNVSFIQSVTPTGQIVVGSQGTIVAATRLLSQVSGGFASQSTVALGPAFQMETHVQFTLSTPNVSAFVLMAICEDGPAPIAESPSESHHSHENGHADPSPSHGHGGRHHDIACEHRHDHHAQRSRHERAIDQNLETGVDWSLGDTLGEHARQRGSLAA